MGVTTYSNAFGMIVSETRNGVESTYVPDTLGSTIGLIDSAGTLTDRWEYWPFGEVVSRSGPSITPFTYIGTLGYRQDIAGSLSYVRARHLELALARWLTVDPIWPDEAAYTYVANSPAWLVDLVGLFGCSTDSWNCGMSAGPKCRAQCSTRSGVAFCIIYEIRCDFCLFKTYNQFKWCVCMDTIIKLGCASGCWALCHRLTPEHGFDPVNCIHTCMQACKGRLGLPPT